MRRSTAISGLLILFLFSAAGAGADTGVRINAGLSHISYGDFNDFVDDTNYELEQYGIEMDNINWVPEIQGEVMYSPAPMFTLGLGAGMIFASSDLSTSIGGFGLDFEHKIRVYPITVTGYFKPSVPMFPVKPYIYGGAGLYHSKMEFGTNLGDVFESVDPEVVYFREADLSATGFGLHGGAGIEFAILPLLSLQVGIQARWADVSGFEGTGTTSGGENRDVFLVAQNLEAEIGGETVEYYSYGPMDSSVKDQLDEGSLDLTGYGFVMGLKLAF